PSAPAGCARAGRPPTAETARGMMAPVMRTLVVLLALTLGACATEPRLGQPQDVVPDLRGTWQGTWGGAPVTLLVLEQGGTTRQGGISVGPWALTGAGTSRLRWEPQGPVELVKKPAS